MSHDPRDLPAYPDAAPRSAALLEQARRVIPGGVNSPVRAFRSVGGTPRFMRRAQGPWLEDADGRRYVDLICSWGPMILGHAHPDVLDAVRAAAAEGFSFGTPTEREVLLAQEIVRRVEPVESVRLVNSGTEATMSALRVARGFTGRSVVVKFAGCYHGHVDALLASAGSGVATFALPDSPGVPASSAAETIVLPYNDVAALETAFAERGPEIAAVITEAAAGNMGVVPPRRGFTEALLRVTRAARGAAHLRRGDDRLPVQLAPGWFGARGVPERRARQTCSPSARSWVAVSPPPPSAAGPTSWRCWRRRGPSTRPGPCRATRWPRPPDWPPCRPAPRRSTRGSTWWPTPSPTRSPSPSPGTAAAPHPVGRVDVQRVLPRGGGAPTSATAKDQDAAAFGRFFHAMLRRGVHLPPSCFESWFVSAAHDDAAVDHVVRAVHASAAEIAQVGVGHSRP